MTEPANRSIPGGLSAIVPAYGAGATLSECLAALLPHVGHDLVEVLVVDDASTDGSAEVAERLGARVLRLPSNVGPAAARNAGARQASGDVLLFVDADVVVHEDAISRLRSALTGDSYVAAFGSYDDRPRHTGFASLYMNLRHHVVHQRAKGEATTFWAGLGAVQKAAFFGVDGFDAERFHRPSIEDVDLGYRMCDAGGRIRLVADATCTHLKRWTLASALTTDVFARALPWARLLVRRPEPTVVLNLSRRERIAALVAWLSLGAALGSACGAIPASAPVPPLLAAAALCWPLLQAVHRRGGIATATLTLFWHQLYYLYSSLVLAYCEVENALEAVRSPSRPGTR